LGEKLTPALRETSKLHSGIPSTSYTISVSKSRFNVNSLHEPYEKEIAVDAESTLRWET